MKDNANTSPAEIENKMKEDNKAIRAKKRKRQRDYNLIGFCISFIIVIGALVLADKMAAKNEKTPDAIEISSQERYDYLVSAIPYLQDIEIKNLIDSFGEKYANSAYHERDEFQNYLISLKIEKENRWLAGNCKREKPNATEAVKHRTELQRLDNIETIWPTVLADMSPKCPQDLFYGFLWTNNVRVSQSTKEHYSRNGFLAIDVATSGKKDKVYAPDLYNKEIEWNIEFTRFSDRTIGKALVFTSDDHKIIFGHVGSWNGVKTAKTGAEVGIVGGCGDGLNEGVSTGCHLHIEYYMWDKAKEDWIIFEYKSEKSIRHKEVETENGVIAQDVPRKEEKKCVEYAGSRYVTPDINDPWFFRDNNNNWKGVQGFFPKNDSERRAAYSNDFRINCSGDCTIGAMGIKLIPQFSVACDSKKDENGNPVYPFGTKFEINGKHFECQDRGGAIRDAKRGGKFAIDFYVEKSKWNDFDDMLKGTACFL